MSYNHLSDQVNWPVTDPYSDPVAYLASLGIEAELIEVVVRLPEAA